MVVEKQFSYTKKIFASRKEFFQTSFKNPLFEGEQSPAEVFIHGITPLYQNCCNILNIEFNEHIFAIDHVSEITKPERYIELYERTLFLLKEIQKNIKEEDFNNFLDIPNSESRITLREWLNVNIMHTVTHVGQALRLQSLYIRNKLRL